MIKRHKTREVPCGKLVIGGDHPIWVQSLTTTKTADVEATKTEIRRMLDAGCEIVRVAVFDMADAQALGTVKKFLGDTPLVSDIHFNHKFGLEAIAQGVDKVRLNPGNVGGLSGRFDDLGKERVKIVAEAAKKKGICMRVGVNSGSVEKDLLDKYGWATADAIVESAMRHCEWLEACGFKDTVVAYPGQVTRVREWYAPHLERIHEQAQVRAGDLEQLEKIALQFETRERFLTELALDPPSATGDLSGAPHLDEDYLVLSTVHSAKGQEWDAVYLLNVADGSFPSEFSTGRAELIEEERRLLYVAMTRAKSDLDLIAPLRYYVTQQSRMGDRHVYGARSRFVTDSVMSCLEQCTFGDEPVVKIAARLRAMW